MSADGGAHGGTPSPMARAVMAALGGEHFEAESPLVLLLAVLVQNPRGMSARDLRSALRRRKQDLARELRHWKDVGLVETSKRIARGGGSLWRITRKGRQLLRRQPVTLRAGTVLAG